MVWRIGGFGFTLYVLRFAFYEASRLGFGKFAKGLLIIRAKLELIIRMKYLKY